MIKILSRKERRIQKALGTEEDMPPTIWRRAQFWWWRHMTPHTYKWTIDEFWHWLAFKLPRKLIYYSAIRIWAHATQCPSGCKENVYVTTMDNALKRWEKE